MRNKLSQVSLFFILGIIIIILILVFFTLPKNNIKGLDYSISSNNDKASYFYYIQDCLITEFNNAEIETESLDEIKIKQHILDNIDSCIDSLNYSEKGYTLTKGEKNLDVTKSENAFTLDLTYPLIFENKEKKTTLRYDSFKETIRFDNSFELNQNSEGEVLSSQILRSPDGDMIIIIPQGTKITDSNGNPLLVEEIAIHMVSRVEEDPISLLGGIKYNLSLHDVYFNPPITIVMNYPKNYLASLGEYFALTYYDKNIGWVDVPTKIYLNEGYLSGEFSYLP